MTLAGVFILWLWVAAIPERPFVPFYTTAGYQVDMLFDNLDNCNTLMNYRRKHFPNDPEPAVCLSGDALPSARMEIFWR